MDTQLAGAPYRDASRLIEERVEDLLGRMTLEEKISQLGGIDPSAFLTDDRFDESKAEVALARGIGHISRIGGSTILPPAESARVANDVQRFLIEGTRLGVPAIVHEESCAGYTARGGTCFPQAIGLASTWSPELIEEMTTAIRRQMRAVGAHQSLAPVLDIARDPRWGRMEETYGEDPYLASRIGVAYVRGLQGDDLRNGIACTAKHFIGYGASEGGMNWAPAHISPRELREVYAVPFEAAIREAGLASMMNAYHEMDGLPCGGSKEILDDLLRGELGFDGAVVSDYFTVRMLRFYHYVAGDKEGAARQALEAGLDVELPALNYYETLRDAVTEGRIEVALIDRAVRRVLKMKFALGLFEQPYVDADAAPAAFDTRAARALARRIAQQSIVLLKNDGGLLPLEDVRKIAVIGPAANSARLLQGDYHYPTHLEMMYGAIRDGDMPEEQLRAANGMRGRFDLNECMPRTVTLLEGIRERAGAGVEVTYARGCDTTHLSLDGIDEAVQLAREADVTIVALGGRSGLVDGCTSGESSDAADLSLPGVQQQLVDAVAATGTPVVAVIVSGRPLALTHVAQHAGAILYAWVPGEEGGAAVADVLFGEVSPSGRLPVTLVRDAGQVPLFYNHKPSGGRSHWRTDYTDMPSSPLYCFGHGLSYTTFEYSNLRIALEEVDAEGRVEISVDVRNTGERAGDEVVQLYLHDVVASVTPPVKQLAGFARASLAAGESRTIGFELDLSQLAFYDREMRFVIEPGEIEVMVGASSEDIRASGRFEIVGERRVVRRGELRATAVSVR